MELVNELYAVEERVARTPTSEIIPASLGRRCSAILYCCSRHLLRICERTLEMSGEKGSLLRAPWPKYDPALAKEDEIEIPVQINGKLRGLIVVPAGSTDDVIRKRFVG